MTMNEREIIRWGSKTETFPRSISVVAIVGKNGQVGRLLSERILTASSKPLLYVAGRGEIKDIMSQNPEVVVAATPNPVNEVVSEIVASAKKPFTLVLPQNGIGVIEQTKDILKFCGLPIVVLRASLFTPVNREGDGILYNPNKLRIALAPIDNKDNALTLFRIRRFFEDIGFEVNIFADYIGLEWTKLLANLVCSTSTVTGLTPIETFSDKGLFEIELQGLKERVEIIKALGINILDIPWAKTGMLLASRHLPEGVLSILRVQIAKVVASGRNNQPSAAGRKIMTGETPSEVLCYHQPFIDASRDTGLSAHVDTAIANIIKDHIGGRINLQQMEPIIKRQLILDASHGNR